MCKYYLQLSLLAALLATTTTYAALIVQIDYPVPLAGDITAVQYSSSGECKDCAIIHKYKSQVLTSASPTFNIEPKQSKDTALCDKPLTWTVVPVYPTPVKDTMPDQIKAATSVLQSSTNTLVLTFTTVTNKNFTMTAQTRLCEIVTKAGTTLHFARCGQDINDEKAIDCCWTEDGTTAGCQIETP